MLTLTQAGCALSSGMVPPSKSNAKEISNLDSAIDIIPISPELIISQVRNKSAEKVAPEAVVRQPTQHEYRIAPHDILAITVWDHPELTIPSGANPPPELIGNVVRNDGSIFYPYVGVIIVAGKTVEEARSLITKKLSHYIEKPQVDVRIAKYKSQFVYVTGEVNSPRTIALTASPLDMVSAINEAGGLKSSADLSHILLIHYDGTKETIDISKLQTQGKLSENRSLKAGDHLFVPDSSNNVVFVTGEVKTPGSKQLGYQRYTLTRALADAGGIDNNTSNPSQVYVLRGFTENLDKANPKVSVKIYHLDATTPTGLILGNQFELQAQDVIFVSSTNVARWGRVMNNLATTIQALSLARLFQ
ncbi:MAG: polysaccharide biosynthesis/export family protein [Flavobacteriales bacterium]|nr:polysaccharide biosynthesis/export family protein [Flavobacteriales bacterium]